MIETIQENPNVIRGIWVKVLRVVVGFIADFIEVIFDVDKSSVDWVVVVCDVDGSSVN